MYSPKSAIATSVHTRGRRACFFDHRFAIPTSRVVHSEIRDPQSEIATPNARPISEQPAFISVQPPFIARQPPFIAGQPPFIAGQPPFIARQTAPIAGQTGVILGFITVAPVGQASCLSSQAPLISVIYPPISRHFATFLRTYRNAREKFMAYGLREG
jgi:hypothetical protein